jgi:uncharacterized protein with von Willebrand factor type A (vWA) domain
MANITVENIRSLDYSSLVNLLNSPISAKNRKIVLDRLTRINNKLLEKEKNEIDIDGILDEIKKEPDVLDIKLDRISKLYKKISNRK